MKGEVVADVVVLVLAASTVPAPSPPGVCFSPSEALPSCAPASGLGFAYLNANAIVDDNDCTELDCDDANESFHNDPHQEHAAVDVLGYCRSDVVPLQSLSCRQRGANLRDFGNDFTQATLD